MMDEKNNGRGTDNDKAAEILEKLRKMLDSSSQDPVNDTVAESENSAFDGAESEKDARYGEKPAATGFDGILTDLSKSASDKPKKKYNAYLDDEPLFSFDGFAFDESDDEAADVPSEVQDTVSEEAQGDDVAEEAEVIGDDVISEEAAETDSEGAFGDADSSEVAEIAEELEDVEYTGNTEDTESLDVPEEAEDLSESEWDEVSDDTVDVALETPDEMAKEALEVRIAAEVYGDVEAEDDGDVLALEELDGGETELDDGETELDGETVVGIEQVSFMDADNGELFYGDDDADEIAIAEEIDIDGDLDEAEDAESEVSEDDSSSEEFSSEDAPDDGDGAEFGGLVWEAHEMATSVEESADNGIGETQDADSYADDTELEDFADDASEEDEEQGTESVADINDGGFGAAYDNAVSKELSKEERTEYKNDFRREAPAADKNDFSKEVEPIADKKDGGDRGVTEADKKSWERPRGTVTPSPWRGSASYGGGMLSWDEMERFIAEKEHTSRYDHDDYDTEYVDDDYDDGDVYDDDYYADGDEYPETDDAEAEVSEVSVAEAIEYFREITEDENAHSAPEGDGDATVTEAESLSDAEAVSVAEEQERAKDVSDDGIGVPSVLAHGLEGAMALERGYLEPEDIPGGRKTKKAESDAVIVYEEMDDGSGPILATEIEEAVSIAEEYGTSDVPIDVGKNLFFGEDTVFEEMDGPPVIATEIEELSIATEITSNIVKPEEIEGALEEEPEEDSTSPDWVPDESFLRECAQLELPKLTHIFKPANETETEDVPDVRSSGYSYVEPPQVDAYILEKARRKRQAKKDPKNGTSPTDDIYSLKDDKTLRAEFYADRAETRRSAHRAEERSALRNTVYMSVLTLIIFIFENIGNLLSESAVTAHRAYWLLGFDIALLAVGGFIIRASVKSAISDLLAMRFNCETVGAMALILSFVYGACAAFTYTGEGEIPLVGTALMACMLYSCVIRAISVKRSKVLFENTFDEGEYCSLAELERNSAIPEFKELDGVIGKNAHIYRPNHPKRTEGGYKADRRNGGNGRFGAILTAVAIGFSLLSGIITLITVGEPAEAAYIACMALLMSLPVFASVSAFSSAGVLLKRSAQKGAWLMDEKAVKELENGAVLLINDTDMFNAGDVKIIGLETPGADLGDGEFEAVLGRIVSVVRTLGGPIAELFSKLGEGLDINNDVCITDISESGVSGSTDGSFVRIGSASYMGKYGVRVPEENLDRKDGEQVTYIAENGVLRIKMTLLFTANKTLCKRINELRGCGVAVSLKTCDPCIDTELVIRTTGIEPELLRVVKYAVDDQRDGEDGERDGGIISTDGVSGLIAAMSCCARHNVTTRRLKIISAIASLAIPVVFSVLAATSVPILSVPVWMVGAYYGASALSAVALSKIL